MRPTNGRLVLQGNEWDGCDIAFLAPNSSEMAYLSFLFDLFRWRELAAHRLR